MKLLRLAIVLALFTVAPAWGECAWVLWRTTTMFGKTETWIRLSPTDSQAVCEVLRLGKIAGEKRSLEEVKAGNDAGRPYPDGSTIERVSEQDGVLTVIWKRGRGNEEAEFVTYQCWPVTVDPRN